MIVWVWVCKFFFFKQKTAYEMRISDWSSDVCSSDLRLRRTGHRHGHGRQRHQDRGDGVERKISRIIGQHQQLTECEHGIVDRRISREDGATIGAGDRKSVV